MTKIALITLDLAILNWLWISNLNCRHQQKHQESIQSNPQQQLLNSLTNNNNVIRNTIGLNLKTFLTCINITLERIANGTISNTIIVALEKKF